MDCCVGIAGKVGRCCCCHTLCGLTGGGGATLNGIERSDVEELLLGPIGEEVAERGFCMSEPAKDVGGALAVGVVESPTDGEEVVRAGCSGCPDPAESPD